MIASGKLEKTIDTHNAVISPTFPAMAWASNSNSDSMIRTFHFVGLALAVVLTAGTSAHAQTRTAVFEDGSKLDYNVLSESPEDLKPMWLHWGTFSEGALYGAQIDKWIPGKARIQFTTSLAGPTCSCQAKIPCSWTARVQQVGPGGCAGTSSCPLGPRPKPSAFPSKASPLGTTK